MSEFEIPVRVEGRRGCGYRKKGGLYLIAGKPSEPCGRLPIPLTVCPCCNAGIKPSRGWTWVQPRPLFQAKRCTYLPAEVPADPPTPGHPDDCTCALCEHGPPDDVRLPLHRSCPLADENLPERCGLIWVGGKFYERPETFMKEAAEMGISRRIPAVPRDFKSGETWVLLAHRECIAVPNSDKTPGAPMFEHQAGIFTMFRPTVEYVCRGDETDEELLRLHERGIQPVIVQNPGRTADDADSDGDDDE